MSMFGISSIIPACCLCDLYRGSHVRAEGSFLAGGSLQFQHDPWVLCIPHYLAQ